ncbi:MAG: hypothetical protein HY667_03965 [Chloroflexi bacterium]|nr:hypothetical protein [Chloroflexota bacterium]
MYDATFIEGKNKPTAVVVNEGFANDARSAASIRGMPPLRIVTTSVPCESSVAADIEAGVTAAIDNIVVALTKPLTAEEKSQTPLVTEKTYRIMFKGNLADVNRFFYKRGWTDGLPIIPPTEEAVAEMLTGTDLPSDHLVAKLGPRLGKATVEKIAVNAVMAGALPTYMPLLIAGVQALAAHPSAVNLAASTGSYAPFWIVNGPIRKDLHVNHGYGALSPGDIANATIGRSLALVTKNIRGVRKGIEDMGVLGNPGKYGLVIAENDEDNPWEPLHIERGFKRDDSTITLSFPQSYQQLQPYGTDDNAILSTLIYNITPERRGILGILFTPTDATSLASRGWTKKDIKDFVMENARVPWDHHPQYWTPEYGGPTNFVDKRKPFNPRDSASILSTNPRCPEPIQIYVAGGTAPYIGLFSGGMEIITQKVELPANWDKLVQKYRDVIPTYARY